MDRSELVTLRPGKIEDKNFVYASWLRGLYYGDSWFKEIPKDLFMKYYHNVVTGILCTPGVQVTVACLKEDPEVILGYSIHKGTRLHWVFVKSAWRGIGIANMLKPSDMNTVTHLTKVGLSIIRKHPGIIFDPFNLS